MTYEKKPPSSRKDILVKGHIKTEKIQINKKKLSAKIKNQFSQYRINQTKLSLSVCIFWYSTFYCQEYFLHFSQNCHQLCNKMRQHLCFRI